MNDQDENIKRGITSLYKGNVHLCILNKLPSILEFYQSYDYVYH